MQLVFERDGRVRGIYGEAIDLATLGLPQISRASYVEPDGHLTGTAQASLVRRPRSRQAVQTS